MKGAVTSSLSTCARLDTAVLHLLHDTSSLLLLGRLCITGRGDATECLIEPARHDTA